MIYVDEPQRTNRGWCHMFSADSDALHIMAYKIGLSATLAWRGSWYQEQNKNFPHYDLSPAKRRAALQLGAKAVTNYQMVEIVREWQAERDYFEKVYIFIKKVDCPWCKGLGFTSIDFDEGSTDRCSQCVGSKTIEVEVEMTQAEWDANF